MASAPSAQLAPYPVVEVVVPAGVSPSPARLGPVATRPADSAAGPRINVERPFAAVRPVGPTEAAQLAEMFALDYLSWDETAPQRRAEALRAYLAESADPRVGWSGTGRQRAEFATAGAVESDGWRLWVDVGVRVTRYEPLWPDPPSLPDQPDPLAAPDLPPASRPSSAPPATALGWVVLDTVWLRLSVPVRRHDCGGLVVDLTTVPPAPAPAADSGSGSGGPAAHPPAPDREDPAS